MTPLNQRKQRLMAFECGAASAGQEAKAIIQPRRNLFGRKDLGSRGGEFNRQRDAVQPSADICNRGCILLLEAEGWVCCHCATNVRSASGANSTSHTPSENSSNTSAANCMDKRVLPVPPGPVSVNM